MSLVTSYSTIVTHNVESPLLFACRQQPTTPRTTLFPMGKQELPWVGFEPTTTLQSRQAHTDYAGTKTLYLEPITVLLFYLLTASENHTSLSLSLSLSGTIRVRAVLHHDSLRQCNRRTLLRLHQVSIHRLTLTTYIYTAYCTV